MIFNKASPCCFPIPQVMVNVLLLPVFATLQASLAVAEPVCGSAQAAPANRQRKGGRVYEFLTNLCVLAHLTKDRPDPVGWKGGQLRAHERLSELLIEKHLSDRGQDGVRGGSKNSLEQHYMQPLPYGLSISA